VGAIKQMSTKANKKPLQPERLSKAGGFGISKVVVIVMYQISLVRSGPSPQKCLEAVFG